MPLASFHWKRSWAQAAPVASSRDRPIRVGSAWRGMAGSCGKRSAQRLQHHRHPGASRSAPNRDRPTPCRGAAGADTLAAMEHKPMQRPRGRGIYLLPNLFTTGGLFGGFFANIADSQGRLEAASVAIFIAAIRDGLDGSVGG